MSSSAVRSVCNDKPLLLASEAYEGIEAVSAIESVRSKKEVSGLERTSLCSIEGGKAMAFGLEDRDRDEAPRNIEVDGGEVFRDRGWCMASPSGEGKISAISAFCPLSARRESLQWKPLAFDDQTGCRYTVDLSVKLEIVTLCTHRGFVAVMGVYCVLLEFVVAVKASYRCAFLIQRVASHLLPLPGGR